MVGRYELLTQIARGGMGTVYLARMRGMGGFTRDVALKLVHEHLDQEQAQLDLLEEAKIAARLRHPNAVPVLDVGEDQGSTYIVMDYVEGDSLAGLLRGALRQFAEPLPLAVSLHAVLDSLSGLHAAHELLADDGTPLGLVHRDYSPQNILVGADGITRLTDFGIAKLRATEGTQSGFVKGKVRYMSPEQARGLALDRRCDVWAAGVVLWELLAGRRLFPADNDATVLLRIVSDAPPPLRAVAPQVHPALDAVVAGALQMELARRIPTALELRKQLAKALKEAQLTTEQEEVAANVNRIAGPAIAERRARLAAIQREAAARGTGATPFTPLQRPHSRPDLSTSTSPGMQALSTSGPFHPRPVVDGETTSAHASLVSPHTGSFEGQPPYDPHFHDKPSKRIIALVAAASLIMVAVGTTLIAVSVRRAAPAIANASPATAETVPPSLAAQVTATDEPTGPADAGAATAAAVESAGEPPSSAPEPAPTAAPATSATIAARPHAPVQATPLALPGGPQAPVALPPPRGGDGLAASPYRKKK